MFTAALAALLLAAALWQASRTGELALAQSPDSFPSQEIVDEVSGPYRITARATGSKSVSGTQRVMVNVLEVSSGEPITDARIAVFGTPPDGGRRLYSPALNSPSDRLTYISQISLNKDGVWTIDVEVEAGAGVAGAEGILKVEPRVRSGDNVPYGTAVLVLIILAFAAGVAWLVFQSRRTRRARGISQGRAIGVSPEGEEAERS